MAKTITKAFGDSKTKLVLDDDKTAEYALANTGAEPNTDQMIIRLTEYPFWQRFIPGSILWQSAQVGIVDVYFTGKRLSEFAAQQAKEFSFPPQNAHLTIKDGRIETANEMAGSAVDAAALQEVLSKSTLVLGGVTTVSVPSTRVEPTEKANDLAGVRTQAELALSHTVVIKVDRKEFNPDKTEVASWLVLGTSEGHTTLTVDKEKIKAYATKLNETVGTAAGQTNITIVDGREAGRTTGTTGRALDTQDIADKIADALLKQPLRIDIMANLVDIQPSVIFNSKYTATQAGLQAYVNDIARSQNMRIVVQQLDGGRWYAHARDTESIPSASTFKLYLAKILFDKIDAGEIHWNDPILDTTVAGCFERMTVASTNPCAESWIAQWGRGYINDYIYRLGFSTGTSFTTGGAVQTTAADLQRFMTGLNNGTILNGANRDRLLDSLGRHPYRYGIPTGSAGVVHDKVGFLWDYVHDTAIVQHPRGTYIMTIMTKGQSYGAIAAVTREIERIMYP